MPANVPTMDEFQALVARVDALENAGGGTVGGVQAKRIVDLFRFGVNTFSSMDEHNVWGSWPADYRPESVIAGLRWLVQDTGHVIGIREYHYAGRESFQRPWFQQIKAAFPGIRNTICVGANGTAADVPSMVAMQQDASTGVRWAEGLNEPNTDFGNGQVPYEVTLAIQEAVWEESVPHLAMGPSIVAGTPHPEGWVQGYCGTEERLDDLVNWMETANGHYYPPGSPDVPGTGYSVAEYVGGLRDCYGETVALTEFHPTLYNSQGHKPNDPGWSGARDAYYTLTTLFRCGSVAHSLWWYALYDYGTTYTCGLFPERGCEAPREAAYALRALCALCPDRGANAATFAPGRLDYAVTETDDASVSHDLYQASDGTWFIALWRSLPELGGEPVLVTVDFPDRRPARIEEYDLTRIAAERVAGDYQPEHEWLDFGTVTVALDGSVRILRIVM